MATIRLQQEDFDAAAETAALPGRDAPRHPGLICTAPAALGFWDFRLL